MKQSLILASAVSIALAACTAEDPGREPASDSEAASQRDSMSDDTDDGTLARDADVEVEAAGSEDDARADAGAMQDSIPERFHGRWAESLDHCETRGHQRYDIGAREIGFFESTGIVQNVRVDGDYAAATISEQYGDAPPAEYAFYMAIEEADTMRVRYDDRARFRIYRCP